MSIPTLLFFIAMYIYGFCLMIWAIFFDKHPTKTTVNASIFGLIVLTCTLFYFFYVLITIGIL
ncbi:hypothetical protein [Candidatus Protochlamydia phocaeensis]|uniref:hypothetical protein n=1 Tax=Candidatus Protochlamydia phocaeensis TaxID=1414722 RepID=UPI000838D491|nr:hypothetical protein [Candidatus Protochlamydia phocaeensis]